MNVSVPKHPLALAAIAGLIHMAGSPASGQPQLVVKIASATPADSPEAKQLSRLAEELAAKSDGQLLAKIFPAARLGQGKELVERLARGEIQIAALSLETLAEQVPAAELLSAPHIFNTQAHADRALDRAAGKVLDELLEAQGLRRLGSGPTLLRHWFVAGKLPKAPQDLKDFHRPRAGMAERLAWASWGVPLPSPPESDSDKPIFVSATGIEARLAGWDERATQIVAAEDVLVGSQLVVSARWQAGLPERLIDAVKDLEAPAVDEARAALRSADETLLQRMASRGLKREALPAPTRKAFRHHAVEVYKAIAHKAGPEGHRLLAALRGK